MKLPFISKIVGILSVPFLAKAAQNKLESLFVFDLDRLDFSAPDGASWSALREPDPSGRGRDWGRILLSRNGSDQCALERPSEPSYEETLDGREPLIPPRRRLREIADGGSQAFAEAVLGCDAFTAAPARPRP